MWEDRVSCSWFTKIGLRASRRRAAGARHSPRPRPLYLADMDPLPAQRVYPAGQWWKRGAIDAIDAKGQLQEHPQSTVHSGAGALRNGGGRPGEGRADNVQEVKQRERLVEFSAYSSFSSFAATSAAADTTFSSAAAADNTTITCTTSSLRYIQEYKSALSSKESQFSTATPADRVDSFHTHHGGAAHIGNGDLLAAIGNGDRIGSPQRRCNHPPSHTWHTGIETETKHVVGDGGFFASHMSPVQREMQYSSRRFGDPESASTRGGGGGDGTGGGAGSGGDNDHDRRHRHMVASRHGKDGHAVDISTPPRLPLSPVDTASSSPPTALGLAELDCGRLSSLMTCHALAARLLCRIIVDQVARRTQSAFHGWRQETTQKALAHRHEVTTQARRAVEVSNSHRVQTATLRTMLRRMQWGTLHRTWRTWERVILHRRGLANGLAGHVYSHARHGRLRSLRRWFNVHREMARASRRGERLGRLFRHARHSVLAQAFRSIAKCSIHSEHLRLTRMVERLNHLAIGQMRSRSAHRIVSDTFGAWQGALAHTRACIYRLTRVIGFYQTRRTRSAFHGWRQQTTHKALMLRYETVRVSELSTHQERYTETMIRRRSSRAISDAWSHWSRYISRRDSARHIILRLSSRKRRGMLAGGLRRWVAAMETARTEEGQQIRRQAFDITAQRHAHRLRKRRQARFFVTWRRHLDALQKSRRQMKLASLWAKRSDAVHTSRVWRAWRRAVLVMRADANVKDAVDERYKDQVVRGNQSFLRVLQRLKVVTLAEGMMRWRVVTLAVSLREESDENCLRSHAQLVTRWRNMRVVSASFRWWRTWVGHRISKRVASVAAIRTLFRGAGRRIQRWALLGWASTVGVRSMRLGQRGGRPEQLPGKGRRGGSPMRGGQLGRSGHTDSNVLVDQMLIQMGGHRGGDLSSSGVLSMVSNVVSSEVSETSEMTSEESEMTSEECEAALKYELGSAGRSVYSLLCRRAKLLEHDVFMAWRIHTAFVAGLSRGGSAVSRIAGERQTPSSHQTPTTTSNNAPIVAVVPPVNDNDSGSKVRRAVVYVWQKHLLREKTIAFQHWSSVVQHERRMESGIHSASDAFGKSSTVTRWATRSNRSSRFNPPKSASSLVAESRLLLLPMCTTVLAPPLPPHTRVIALSENAGGATQKWTLAAAEGGLGGASGLALGAWAASGAISRPQQVSDDDDNDWECEWCGKGYATEGSCSIHEQGCSERESCVLRKSPILRNSSIGVKLQGTSQWKAAAFLERKKAAGRTSGGTHTISIALKHNLL